MQRGAASLPKQYSLGVPPINKPHIYPPPSSLLLPFSLFFPSLSSSFPLSFSSFPLLLFLLSHPLPSSFSLLLPFLLFDDLQLKQGDYLLHHEAGKDHAQVLKAVGDDEAHLVNLDG